MAERKTRAEIVAEAAKRNKEKQRLKAQKTAAKSGDAQFQRDAANRASPRSMPSGPPREPRLQLTSPVDLNAEQRFRANPAGSIQGRLRGTPAQRPPAPMLQTPRASGPQAVRDFGVTRRYPAPARVDTLGLNLDKPRNYAQIRADAPNARTIPPDVRGVQAPRPRTPRGTPILGPAILGAELMTQSDPAQAPLVDPVNNPEDYQRMVELGIDPDQYIEDLIASGDYFVEPDMLAEAVRNVGGMQGQPLMEQEFFPSPAVEMPNQIDLLTSLMPDEMAMETQFDPSMLGIDFEQGFNSPEEMLDRLLMRQSQPAIIEAARPDLQEHMDRYAEFMGRDQLSAPPPDYIPEEDRISPEQLRAQITDQYWQEQAQPQQRFASANDMAANYDAPMQLAELNALLGGIAQDEMRNAEITGEPFLQDIYGEPVEGIDFAMVNGVPTFTQATGPDATVTESAFYGGTQPESAYTGRQTMDDIRLRNAYTQLAFDQLGEAQGVQTDADRLYDSYSTQAQAAQYEADQIQENLDRMQRQLIMTRDPQRAAQIGAAIEVETAQLAAAQNAAQQARNRQLELFGQALTGGTDTVDQINAMEQRRAVEAELNQRAQQRAALQEQQQQLRNQLSDEDWESVLETQLPTDPIGQPEGAAQRNRMLQSMARRYRAATGDYALALNAVIEFMALPPEDQEAVLQHPQGVDIFLQEYLGGA